MSAKKEIILQLSCELLSPLGRLLMIGAPPSLNVTQTNHLIDLPAPHKNIDTQAQCSARQNQDGKSFSKLQPTNVAP